jgi:hypothetical protein
VADITRAEVRDLYEELKLKRGKTSAGGAMRVLRALINTAMRIDETIPAIRAPPFELQLPLLGKWKCWT